MSPNMETLIGNLPAGGNLTISQADTRFDDHIAATKAHLESLTPEYFRDRANQALTDPNSGMQYLWVGSRALDSGIERSYIGMSSPFGNGIWPHLVARAEVVAEKAYELGLRGADDEPVPVLLTAAPSKHSAYGLNAHERAKVGSGDARPIAHRLNRTAYDAGMRVVKGNVAFSMPAAHAATQMVEAQQHMDVDGVTILGDPPHARQARPFVNAINFGREGLRFDGEVEAEGIGLVKQILTSPGMVPGVIKNHAEYRPIARDFRRGELADDLVMLGVNGLPGVVLNAGSSYVAPRLEVARSVAEAREELREGDSVYVDPRHVEIADATHAFADRLGRFGVVAAELLTLTEHKFSFPKLPPTTA